MTARIAMDDLNGKDRAAFTAALGHVFEKSPWVAERTWSSRPFVHVSAMHESMVEAVRAASPDERLNLIRAHPDLAPKMAVAKNLTSYSKAEQADAGLDRCTPEEFRRFQDLNTRYRAKFDFPFVIAVKGLDRRAILDTFEARLDNDRDTEFAEAINQIVRIAEYRLRDLLAR